jgi:Peptidase M15
VALRRRPRSFIMLAYAELALGALLVAGARPADPPASAAFSVRYGNLDSPHPVRALTVLPGETVTFEVAHRSHGVGYVARPAAGRLVPLDAGRWEWTAPPAPGLYPIHVVGPGGTDSVTLQAFVVVPYDRLAGDFLNGYRIGRYPGQPARGGIGHGPPAGFVEVTRENENVLVSPHFRLKQFLCKQAAGYPKYVVLDERLLLALEHVLQRVHEAGYQVTTFHVMSGYRTPAYNRSLGNVRYSQHQWGAAADIFIDEDLNGVMDDLNGDGRSSIGDAEVLYRLIDDAAARPEAQGLIGGLGKYPSTAAHGPFVHVDVRDGTARW